MLATLATARPDVLLLDISMPGLTGLELARGCPRRTRVIFVTAHAHHAVEAFEVGAVDYVLKPVTGARLAKAIDRTRARGTATTGEPGAAIHSVRAGVVLVIRTRSSMRGWMRALVTIATALESWITTATLRELEERLPPRFARVDRRHLLNVDEVARLEPEADGGYLAVTHSGGACRSSRRGRPDATPATRPVDPAGYPRFTRSSRPRAVELTPSRVTVTSC